jgi:hypothetical protein
MAKSKILENDPLDIALSKLREDAIERGMLDIAMVYGWSQIKRRMEILDAQHHSRG